MTVVAQRKWPLEVPGQWLEASEVSQPLVLIESAESDTLGLAMIAIAQLQPWKSCRFDDVQEVVAELGMKRVCSIE